MPTYDYQCRSCGAVVEVVHSMLEDGPTTCERCGGQLRRVINPSGIIFKGSGFYRNDSRSSDADSTSHATRSGTSSGGAEGSAASGSGDGTPAAPKTDTAPKASSGSGNGAGD
ncbi:MAG: FmdB family transcriptional regulator [Chloroflexota bacterium]|nr:FmdB family transcriptional regulator [Chloroflexota bacterium]